MICHYEAVYMQYIQYGDVATEDIALLTLSYKTCSARKLEANSLPNTYFRFCVHVCVRVKLINDTPFCNVFNIYGTFFLLFY